MTNKITYCPDEGSFTWKKNGKKAGGIDKTMGYYQIVETFSDGRKKKHYGHRLAFQLMGVETKKEIDHIDHDRANNKWENLRLVTRRENSRNHSRNKNNTSGHVGITWDKKSSLWQSQIMIDYKCIVIGKFKDKDEAIWARVNYQKNIGFHANHGV